jgi:hypothetical protein
MDGVSTKGAVADMGTVGTRDEGKRSAKAVRVREKRRLSGAKRAPWTTPNLEQVRTLARYQLPDESDIAVVLGINLLTLKRKPREYEKFTAAIQAGRAIGVCSVASKLHEVALGGDVGAMQFYMRRMGG